MPFYEYECSSCKFYTEVMQKITDAPLTKCPSCGKKALKKLVSAPNFRLKGGGWYETDFKGEQENKRNLAGAEKDETPAKADSKDGDKKADGKEEAAKPEAKTPAKEDSKPAAAAKGRASKPQKSASRSPARSTASRTAGKAKPAKGKKTAARKKTRR